VRAKASSENMAMAASLRKEQMKNESLDQGLQQKVTRVLVFLHDNSTFKTFHSQINTQYLPYLHTVAYRDAYSSVVVLS